MVRMTQRQHFSFVRVAAALLLAALAIMGAGMGAGIGSAGIRQRTADNRLPAQLGRRQHQARDLHSVR